MSEVNLEQWNETYSTTEVEEEGKDVEYTEVPDGSYNVKVDKVDLKNSQNGNPMLAWQLRITGPTQANRVLFRYNMLMNENNVKWLKKDLIICGIKLSKLSDLANHLEDLLDINLEVTKKTNGDFENVYFNKFITEGGGAETSSMEDDVPF